MLATPGALPDGPEWFFEVRWAGLRLHADVDCGRLRLTCRTGRDLTRAFPELRPLARWAPDVVLDGVAVLLADGVPDAAALGERLRRRSPRDRPVTFMVFDVLRLYGVPLLDRPLAQRRATLERLDLAGLTAVTLSPVYTDGPALLTATAQHGLGGVVAKHRDSVYRPGSAGAEWVTVTGA